ncbi:MAG: glutathionylspermidine synthase family protein [Verrucomicrobia bacterium]|nr:glutathionylspermidine synthase family protein [Verrucomicrobiota bacterium]
MSNKGIFPVLWELYPDHPNLLPAYGARRCTSGDYVAQAAPRPRRQQCFYFSGGHTVLASEVTTAPKVTFSTARTNSPFEGHHPIFGTWIVDHEAAGLGIREDTSLITGNLSRFVPHFFQPG